jgi:hypothetical protein
MDCNCYKCTVVSSSFCFVYATPFTIIYNDSSTLKFLILFCYTLLHNVFAINLHRLVVNFCYQQIFVLEKQVTVHTLFLDHSFSQVDILSELGHNERKMASKSTCNVNSND